LGGLRLRHGHDAPRLQAGQQAAEQGHRRVHVVVDPGHEDQVEAVLGEAGVVGPAEDGFDVGQAQAPAARLQVFERIGFDVVGVDLTRRAHPVRQVDRDPAAAGAHLADDHAGPDAQDVHHQPRRLDLVGPLLAMFRQLPGTGIGFGGMGQAGGSTR